MTHVIFNRICPNVLDADIPQIGRVSVLFRPAISVSRTKIDRPPKQIKPFLKGIGIDYRPP